MSNSAAYFSYQLSKMRWGKRESEEGGGPHFWGIPPSNFTSKISRNTRSNFGVAIEIFQNSPLSWTATTEILPWEGLRAFHAPTSSSCIFPSCSLPLLPYFYFLLPCSLFSQVPCSFLSSFFSRPLFLRFGVGGIPRLIWTVSFWDWLYPLCHVKRSVSG